MIKEKKSKLQANEDKFAYLFIAPFVIGFIFLYADLIYSSIVYSFSELVFEGKSFKNVFTGLANFKNVLTVNAEFTPALTSAVTDMITMIPVILIFSLFMSTLLNRKMPGRALFRSIFLYQLFL